MPSGPGDLNAGSLRTASSNSSKILVSSRKCLPNSVSCGIRDKNALKSPFGYVTSTFSKRFLLRSINAFLVLSGSSVNALLWRISKISFAKAYLLTPASVFLVGGSSSTRQSLLLRSYSQSSRLCVHWQPRIGRRIGARGCLGMIICCLVQFTNSRG